MYGKILTKEEFEDMTVDFSAYEKVRSYLEKNLPSSTVKRVGRYVYVSDLEPAQIDDVFQTKMELFQHSVTKHVVYNSRKPYTVPAEILSHVRHIFGISSPLSNSLDVISSTVTTTSTPSLLADPNYLRKRYNIDSECTGENVALLTVLKLLPSNFFSPSDLDTFNEMYGLPSVKVKLETESSDSSCWSDPSNCAENNLDVQYASSTARYCSVRSSLLSPTSSLLSPTSSLLSPTSVYIHTHTHTLTQVHYAQLQESPSSIRINLDTASRVESFISSVLNILNSKSNQKRILSASYTIAGSALDPSTKSEIASLIQESTAQGTTFVVASGDDGARQAQGSCTLFDDTLLASPYAVVVGGTSWKSTQYVISLSLFFFFLVFLVT
jgi:subtilase family serine protease